MVVYILLFLIAISLGVIYYSNIKGTIIIKKPAQVIYVMLVGVCMILVEGLRNVKVGEDLEAYISWFEMYGSSFTLSMFFDLSGFEPGFRLLNYVLHRISDNVQWYIFSMSAIIVSLHLFFLYKNSKDCYISVLLFFGFNFFFTSMVSIRQFIAMGIVLWLYPLLQKKYYVKALICVILGFLFHQSSLIGSVGILGAFLLRKRKKAIVFLSIIALVSIPFVSIIYNYIAGFFGKYSSYYLMSDRTMRIGSLRIVYMALETALIVCISLSKKHNGEESRSVSILLLLSIYCGILSIWVPKIFRIGYYFDSFLILLIPKLIHEETRYRSIFRLGAVAIAIVFFSYYLMNNPGETVPYQFFFE